ncbi:MAG: type VII secretion protein EsaA [Bacillota bacterium]
MTEKASILKLLLVIILIVITPLLFFRTVGDNPLKINENATKSIAIINEDIGIQEEGEEIQFGQNVASILTENSNFEWTVVGRSAGENGLRSLKYDAIVYLPSDLSQNIMTYDEENPVKTNFQYKVQSQLNAVNKEKVLVEIEKATKRVNQKISSLYWNYISADMENIRQEFDEILQKEVAFQETMAAFYKPSSKNLAGQIDEQKAMLTNLQSSIQQVDERAPEQKATMEGYGENLASFVEYVEQYKKYQDEQQTLLAEIQAQSIQSVNQATENQQPLFVQSTSLFEDQGDMFLESMSKIDRRMASNQQAFGQLEKTRYSEVERQINEFYKLQGKILDFYQQLKDTALLNDAEDQLVALSEKLSVGEEDENESTDPTEAHEETEGNDQSIQQVAILNTDEESSDPDINKDNEEGDPGQEGVPEKQEDTRLVDLVVQRQELTAISEEIVNLKEALSNMTELDSDMLEGKLTSLQSLSDRIVQIEFELLGKENEGNPLQGTIERLREENKGLFADKKVLEDDVTKLEGFVEILNDDIEDLNKKWFFQLNRADQLEEELDLYKDYESNIIKEIEKKEQSILASKVLSQTRKDLLTATFSEEIMSKDLLDMMYYYSYLDRYESTLNSMLGKNEAKEAVLNDKEEFDLEKEAHNIVEITSDEQTGWDQLREDMPTTQDALITMEDGFTVFMAKYRQTVDEQHAKLVESLDAIQQDATKVLDQIQQPQQMLTIVEPIQTVEGQELVSDTERISEQMESIHTWMDSIGESQGNIIEYTGELQGRVNDVQVDADKLNNKWASNVASTELIRDDVFSILGNTFVDGQSNGYVYEFLTNPLKISGDIPEESKGTSVTNIPPVVILFIVLICSLLIGYTSYYFQQPPLWIQAILFVLLNLIVGFVISLFGLEIYPLRGESAVEWTVFTILLLATGSALVRVSFDAHHLVGIFITVGMVIFYVTPLLALTTPNFSFTDPMSKVYMSIQYSTDSLFTQAVVVLSLILLGLGVLQYFIGRARIISIEKGSETHAA